MNEYERLLPWANNGMYCRSIISFLGVRESTLRTAAKRGLNTHPEIMPPRYILVLRTAEVKGYVYEVSPSRTLFIYEVTRNTVKLSKPFKHS